MQLLVQVIIVHWWSKITINFHLVNVEKRMAVVAEDTHCTYTGGEHIIMNSCTISCNSKTVAQQQTAAVQVQHNIIKIMKHHNQWFHTWGLTNLSEMIKGIIKERRKKKLRKFVWIFPGFSQMFCCFFPSFTSSGLFNENISQISAHRL